MPDTIINEIDLSQIQEPVFRIKFKTDPNNPGAEPVVRDYEPFSLIEELSAATSETPDKIIEGSIGASQGGAANKKARMFADIRKAFGLPDISGYLCILFMMKLRKWVQSLEVSKEMDAMNAADEEKAAKAERVKGK